MIKYLVIIITNMQTLSPITNPDQSYSSAFFEGALIFEFDTKFCIKQMILYSDVQQCTQFPIFV